MISDKKLVLKPCTPKDVEQAVPLIYSSGPAAFDFVFKNDIFSSQDFLKYAFKKKGGEFGFDNHYALYDNENLLAVGAVFNNKKASRFLFADAFKMIKYYGFGFFARAINGLNIEAMIKPPKKREITLGHLGVKPELRGKGYGTVLINELMKVSKQKKGEYFVLDVSEENPKAKALYIKLGFEDVKRYESKLKNKHAIVPHHFRMELRK